MMTKNNLTTEMIDYFISCVQGTCFSWEHHLNSLNEWGEQGWGNITEADIEDEIIMPGILDDAIFLCHSCSWWYEVGYWIDDEHPNYIEGEDICCDCGDT